MTIVAVNDDGQIDRTYNETITVTFEELRLAKARRLNEPPPAPSGYEIAIGFFSVVLYRIFCALIICDLISSVE